MLPAKVKPSLIRVLSRNYVSQQKQNASAFKYHRVGFQSRMTGWELHEYGDVSEVMQFQTNLRIPKIVDPKELIVRVTGSSVNPLDLAMSGNYLEIFKSKSLLNICFFYQFKVAMVPPS